MNKENSKAIIDLVDKNKQKIVDLLTDLIGIQTPVPPGLNYEKAIEFLSPQFESFGFTCTKHVMPENTFLEKQKFTNQLLDGPRINLQAEKKTGKKPGLVLYAHVDVVPVQEESWTVPPWEGMIKDEKMYGRGTSDCKSSIAAILGALETISVLELDETFDLNILITTDEEVGPYSGLCWLADMGVVWGDYFFCLDGSSDTLGIGANGMLEWMVEVHGKSVHSGISFLGQNAIEQTNLIINGLLELKNEIEKRRSAMPSSPEVQSQTGGKRTNISPVLNVTMINGGVKVNIVPDKCVIKGDRRYIPEENIDEVIKELEDKLAEIKNVHPEISYDLKTRKIYAGYSTEPTQPWVSFVKNIIHYVKGEVPPIAGAQGSIDVGCVMEKRKGMPHCAFGAGTTLESRIHGHDENIRISDLLDLTKVLAMVITNNLN